MMQQGGWVIDVVEADAWGGTKPIIHLIHAFVILRKSMNDGASTWSA